MNILADQNCTATATSIQRWLRRAASAVAIVAIVTTAIGLPVISPEATTESSPVLAIARADCPPDCGGNPGGGNPSGPPGGGTEFVPPSIPAMPPYEPGRGYPAPDQNNGISVYNSATPQPSQAAQPNQTPAQNQDGTYNRAANGEQQPVTYNNAPNNQQPSSDWRELNQRLTRQHGDSSENGASDSATDSDGGDEYNEDLSPEQCQKAWDEISKTGKISDLNSFRPNPSVNYDAKRPIYVRIIPPSVDMADISSYTVDELMEGIHQSMNNWNKKSKMKFVEGVVPGSQKPDLTVVFEDHGTTFTDPDSGAIEESYTAIFDPAGVAPEGEPDNIADIHRLIVNVTQVGKKYSGDYPRIVQILMHELGHSLGLAHSCPGTIMDASGHPSMALTDMDIISDNQGR
ncbi:hypothetical protein MASB_27920 [Mycobacteroides abscessus subsp. bolletii BD]|nr:hypothetical protein MASB_27920 [Mycobacteroides abscessus subsp. bolletii BD]